MFTKHNVVPVTWKNRAVSQWFCEIQSLPQKLEAVDPCPTVVLSSVHCTQALLSCVDLYEPTEHAVHVELPAMIPFPTSQTTERKESTFYAHPSGYSPYCNILQLRENLMCKSIGYKACRNKYTKKMFFASSSSSKDTLFLKLNS